MDLVDEMIDVFQGLGFEMRPIDDTINGKCTEKISIQSFALLVREFENVNAKIHLLPRGKQIDVTVSLFARNDMGTRVFCGSFENLSPEDAPGLIEIVQKVSVLSNCRDMSV